MNFLRADLPIMLHILTRLKRLRGFGFVCVLGICAVPAHAVPLITHSASGQVAMQSWKQMRDARIVKQVHDFSCGAASLATLLNEQYGLSLTEEQIIKDMNKPDTTATFEDMALVVGRYGFKAGGIALSYEQLAKLTVPVVVYLNYQGLEHFSVLRGISATHVHLADPSLGNRILSKFQFMEMWETRNDEQLKGKILLLMPQKSASVKQGSDFFAPPISSNLPINILYSQRNTQR